MRIPRSAMMLAALFAVGHSSATAATLYYTVFGGGVNRIDDDGTNHVGVLGGGANARGIAYDRVNDDLYYTTMVGGPRQRVLRVPDPFAPSHQELVIDAATDANIGEIAVDPASGRLAVIYKDRANTRDKKTSAVRYNLSGGGAVTLASQLQDAGNDFTDLAINSAAGHVFLTDLVDRAIERVNLDGSGGLVTLYNLPGSPADIALDLTNDTVYWTESNFATNEFLVRRGSMSGGAISTLYFGTTSLAGLAVDPLGGHVFFGETSMGTIRRMNLDGSDVVTLVAGGSDGSFALDYDLVSSPVPEPSAVLLFAIGVLGLWASRRHRRADAAAS